MLPLTFMIGAYIAALCCIYACIREARIAGDWRRGLTQFLILVGFAVLFWVLESWANHRAPFYTYPPIFPDMIRHFQPSWLPSWLAHLFAPGGPDPCAQTPSPKVSASIPISGACITFCLMWTARQLLGRSGWASEPFVPVTAPILVGLGALLLDAILDPILATSYGCPPPPIATLHPGHGFWTWHTDRHLVDVWFKIPLFNYVTWYAVPAILVAVVVLGGWLRLLLYRPSAANFRDGALRAFILTMIAVILYVSPTYANAATLQLLLLATIIILSVAVLITGWPYYVRTNPPRWEFVVPMAFYFLFPVFSFLVTRSFLPRLDHIFLLVLSLVFAAVGIFFVISPYWRRTP